MSAYLPIGVTFLIVGLAAFEGTSGKAFIIIGITFMILSLTDKKKESETDS